MADANPYLALLQQEEKPASTAQLLQMFANLVGGASAGIGQTGTWGGVGPGLMMGMQANAQQAHQAEQERLRRAEFGIKASEWDEKRKQREQQAAAMARMAQNLTGGSSVPTPGITSPQPPQVAMGPGGDYDTRLRGYEGGIRQGGMVFNELGSGAFGPYQFMPGTWADVRAKNPNLNLPADMTQATREQHDAAHGAFKGANAGMLQAAGFQPTPENLYLAHRFGAAGAVNLLRADPNKLLAEVLPVEWQRQNPDMRGQTVGGFQRLATERMGGTGVPYRVAENAPPTPYALIPPQGGGEGDPKSGGDLSGWTMPVMPQPQWPAPAQQPPQVAPGGTTPINPNAPVPPFMQRQPQPQPPAPVVQPQYRPPAPGGPVPHGPPIVPPPRPQDLPPVLRQHLADMLQTPGVTPEEYLKEQQRVTSAYHQQLQTQATEGWREQKAAQLHAQGRSEKQIDDEIRKIEEEKKHERSRAEEQAKHERDIALEQKPMLDSQTGQIINVPKPQWGDKRFVPLDAQKEAREAEKLALEKKKAEQDAAQVAVDPKTMRPNQPAIDAAAAKAAAEAKARADVEMQNKPALQFAEKEVARFSENVQPGAEAAANGLTNLYEMKRLTEGDMATGPGIEARIIGARLLDTLGIKDMPQGMVNTTEYLNRASKGVIDVLKTGALGKTQISEGDRKFVEEMAAKNVGYTKQELQRLVDVAIDASHKTLDQHGKSVDRIGRLIGDKVAKDYFKVDRQTYDEWKKDNPAPGGPAGTTQGDPASAAQPRAALPQPTSKADFDKLPKGTRFLDPTGTERTKP